MIIRGEVHLRSFFSEPIGMAYSVARFQPKGYNYPTLRSLAPIREDYSPIRHLPPDQYMKELAEAYESRLWKVRRDLLQLEGVNTLCCWCNKERQSQYSSLFCHTILIGYLIEYLDPTIKVYYEDGRENPVWKNRDQFLSLIDFSQ